MSEMAKDKEGLFPKEIIGFKRFLYTAIAYLIVSIIASIPAFFAGVVLYFLLEEHISNPLKEIFSQTEVWVGIGLNIIFRGYNIIKNIKKPIQNVIKHSAEEKYTLLVYRFFAIYFLGSFFPQLSKFLSLYIYIALLTFLFSISEIKPEYFLRVGSRSSKILKKK